MRRCRKRDVEQHQLVAPKRVQTNVLSGSMTRQQFFEIAAADAQVIDGHEYVAG